MLVINTEILDASLRGRSHIMSAAEGGDMGQKSENLADIICECSLIVTTYFSNKN